MGISLQPGAEVFARQLAADQRDLTRRGHAIRTRILFHEPGHRRPPEPPRHLDFLACPTCGRSYTFGNACIHCADTPLVCETFAHIPHRPRWHPLYGALLVVALKVDAIGGALLLILAWLMAMTLVPCTILYEIQRAHRVEYEPPVQFVDRSRVHDRLVRHTWEATRATGLRITLRAYDPDPCGTLYLKSPDTPRFSTHDCTLHTCTRYARPLYWGHPAARWDDPRMDRGLVPGGYGQWIVIDVPAHGSYDLLLVRTSEPDDCAGVPLEVDVEFRGQLIHESDAPAVRPGEMCWLGTIQVPAGTIETHHPQWPSA